jgi:hypothetical protein
MTRRHDARTLILGILALALVATASSVGRDANAGDEDRARPVVLTPDEIPWTSRGQGVRVAVLQGDPARPGPFTLRLEYPAGYRKGPHTHPHDAYVTVLEGTYFRGYGNTVQESEAHRLTPGTFSLNPAGVSHYEWTTEPAVLQVHAVGPWATTYVNADGSPRPER